MPNEPDTSRRLATNTIPYDTEMEGPGLVDALRFLYEKRLKFLLRFLVFLGVGLVVFLVSYFASPKSVTGTIALSFTGIEKQEYPSGKKFSVEDFRSPDLLTKATTDAGVSDSLNLRDLAAHVYVAPVIPVDVQNRWKKQDRDGVRREEYAPNEFKLDIAVAGLNDKQRMRLFDALIQRYQERVKYDQESAVAFVATGDTSYDSLANNYDFWDIPSLYEENYRLLNRRLTTLITESLQHQDPRFQIAFREVAKSLNTWYATRLMALEALTYQGKLIKNKEIMTQRIQYQIEDLDIQIRQKTQEANEAMRLLGVIDRPKALLAGQLTSKEGIPVVDASALEKFIKSDYVGPVVERISKLQEEIQTMEADKARLQKQLSWLPKSVNITLSQLPSSHRELIVTLSSELKSITQNYNRLLDEFLGATITSKVRVAQSPIVSRGGYSLLLMLVGIVLFSAFLALVYMAVEHLIQQAKAGESPTGLRE